MEALKIAFAILKTIEQEPGMEPNANTYANLCRIAGFLLPHGKERNEIAAKVFEIAKNASQVSPDVIKFFRIAVDSKFRHQYLGPLEDERGYVHYDRAPKAWSRNVK